MTASDRTPHGLVIGKFYPPHEGHHLLVRTASAASERVTVLVLAHAVESIPLANRVAWMREVHAGDGNVTVHGVVDDHPVDFEDPEVWDLHMAEFERGVAEVTADAVTAVFTSEPYGAELARRLGAVDVPVDPGRGLAPISGTQVRADPVGAWERLAAPVRAWLARRVVVVGAESTGTTTLSRDLCDALRARGGSHGRTQWVPEHGRDFTVEKLAVDRARAIVAGTPPPGMDELEWRPEDFERIARRQNELEDAAARVGGPVLVCDTDAFTTAIWEERYLGAPSAATAALGRHHPLYLLTSPAGVPFEQDGIRDGEGIRGWMSERLAEAMATTGRRCVVLEGGREARLARALDAVDELLAEGWALADPVTPANGSRSL